MFWFLCALLAALAVMSLLWPLSKAQFSASSRRLVIVSSGAALVLIPLLSLGLYLYLGQPEWPDQPLADRLRAEPEKMDQAVAILKIEQHLAQEPSDARGWTILTSLYMRTGQLGPAVKAYRHVLALQGESIERNAFLAGLLTAQAGGNAPKEAHLLLDRAQTLIKPTDLDNWQALIRAYAMIGDKERARQVLQEAQKALQSQPEALTTLKELAAEQGL